MMTHSGELFQKRSGISHGCSMTFIPATGFLVSWFFPVFKTNQSYSYIDIRLVSMVYTLLSIKSRIKWHTWLRLTAAHQAIYLLLFFKTVFLAVEDISRLEIF